MNTNEFLEFFEKKCQALKPYLQGVLAIDMLCDVRKLKKGHFIIFNASKKNSKGTHWMCLSRSLDGKYIVFDSLGICKKKEKLLKTYLPNKFDVIYNVSRFQKDDTSTCGLFCLYFLINQTFNLDLTFSELLNKIFSADPNSNEKRILKFISKWSQAK